MGFLEKLRNLPVLQRKIILWSVVAMLALVLFILWVKNVRDKLGGFDNQEVREQIRLPEIPKIEMPATGLPEISEEELKELEKELSGEEIEELKKLYGE